MLVREKKPKQEITVEKVKSVEVVVHTKENKFKICIGQKSTRFNDINTSKVLIMPNKAKQFHSIHDNNGKCRSNACE